MTKMAASRLPDVSIHVPVIIITKRIWSFKKLQICSLFTFVKNHFKSNWYLFLICAVD